MPFLNKTELKKQLRDLGVKITKGNYVKKKDVELLVETISDARQTSTYYKADWHSPLNTKKPTIEQRKSYSQPEGWFVTEQEAMSHYLEAQKIAKEKAIEIEKELDALKKRLGFYISYSMEGDTHGIHEDYQYICITVGGYEFVLKMEQD
jgi:CRISPR/Cas system-associated protein Cas5 (RAMP superfamily)